MWPKMSLLMLLVSVFTEQSFAGRLAVTPQYLDMLFNSGRHDEFARNLGIEDVNFVIPSEAQLNSPMFNKALMMGDIMMTKEQSEQARQALNVNLYARYRWPKGDLPVHVNDHHYTEEQRQTIYAAMDNFNSLRTGVHLRKAYNNDTDYVYIFTGNGCWSHVGRIGKAQPLSLDKNGCVSREILQHELMHAMGFAHEQNRPDRDEYIRVHFENIPEEWKAQYEKQTTNHYMILEPYDYYSLMHYTVLAPYTNKPAFTVLKSGIDERLIGNAWGLTRTDMKKIKKFYSL